MSSELVTFFELYKKNNQPIPNYIELDGKEGFLYPGKALILGGKIYVEPEKEGFTESESAEWFIDENSVNFRLK